MASLAALGWWTLGLEWVFTFFTGIPCYQGEGSKERLSNPFKNCVFSS